MSKNINKIQEIINQSTQTQNEAMRKMEIEISERMKEMDKMVRNGGINKSNTILKR